MVEADRRATRTRRVPPFGHDAGGDALREYAARVAERAPPRRVRLASQGCSRSRPGLREPPGMYEEDAFLRSKRGMGEADRAPASRMRYRPRAVHGASVTGRIHRTSSRDR